MKFIVIDKITKEIAQKYNGQTPVLSSDDGNKFLIKEVPENYNLNCLELSYENGEYILTQDEKKLLDIDLNNKILNKTNRIEIGKRIIAYISVLNDEKNLSVSNVASLFSDPNLQLIRALLQDGSLDSAMSIISEYNTDGGLFTNEDKARILSELEKFVEI